ncbi:PadR family transcriptional regulator [Frankia sp. Cj3]|uniref:PadR family transcriptional regulator n=1 Tax=Frankia sp. Cj3 TaxID=2880976 RepID=UPI001EF44369|nr:PadR family transcriptional regulator [Frankia sp. Cj3]
MRSTVTDDGASRVPQTGTPVSADEILTYLRTLAAQNEVTVSAGKVWSWFGPRPAIGDALRRARRAGLLDMWRVPCPDGRKRKYVRLTDAGRAA